MRNTAPITYQLSPIRSFDTLCSSSSTSITSLGRFSSSGPYQQDANFFCTGREFPLHADCLAPVAKPRSRTSSRCLVGQEDAQFLWRPLVFWFFFCRFLSPNCTTPNRYEQTQMCRYQQFGGDGGQTGTNINLNDKTAHASVCVCILVSETVITACVVVN